MPTTPHNRKNRNGEREVEPSESVVHVQLSEGFWEENPRVRLRLRRHDDSMVQAVPELSAPAHSQVVGSVSSVQTPLLGHVMLPHRPLCDSSRHEDFKEKDNVVESNAIHQDGIVFVPRGQGAHHGSAPNPATPRSSEWQPCCHGT